MNVEFGNVVVMGFGHQRWGMNIPKWRRREMEATARRGPTAEEIRLQREWAKERRHSQASEAEG